MSAATCMVNELVACLNLIEPVSMNVVSGIARRLVNNEVCVRTVNDVRSHSFTFIVDAVAVLLSVEFGQGAALGRECSLTLSIIDDDKLRLYRVGAGCVDRVLNLLNDLGKQAALAKRVVMTASDVMRHNAAAYVKNLDEYNAITGYGVRQLSSTPAIDVYTDPTQVSQDDGDLQPMYVEIKENVSVLDVLRQVRVDRVALGGKPEPTTFNEAVARYGVDNVDYVDAECLIERNGIVTIVDNGRPLRLTMTNIRVSLQLTKFNRELTELSSSVTAAAERRRMATDVISN